MCCAVHGRSHDLHVVLVTSEQLSETLLDAMKIYSIERKFMTKYSCMNWHYKIAGSAWGLRDLVGVEREVNPVSLFMMKADFCSILYCYKCRIAKYLVPRLL